MWLLRILRSIAIWIGPFIVMLLLVATGFLFWVVTTEPGTRWAVNLAVQQLGGRVEGLRGDIWAGAEFDRLQLSFPAADIDLTDVRLQANWRELLDRRLHVQHLSAGSVDIALHPGPEDSSDAPFQMLELPVSIAVDHFAVGDLRLRRDGKDVLPVDLTNMAAAAYLTNDGAQVSIQHARIEHENVQADLEGEASLSALQDPWPLTLTMQAQARGLTADSLLCADRYIANLPRPAGADIEPSAQADGKTDARSQPGEAVDTDTDTAKTGAGAAAVDAANTAAATAAADTASAPSGKVAADAAAAVVGGAKPHDRAQAAQGPCALFLDARVQGSLDDMQIALKGEGQGMMLDADVHLTPRAGFPLKDAVATLQLADGSSLNGRVDWAREYEQGIAQDRLLGALETRNLDVGRLAGGAIPPALLTVDGSFDLLLQADTTLRSADVALSFAEGSRWNGEPLAGKLNTQIINAPLSDQPDKAKVTMETAVRDATAQGRESAAAPGADTAAGSDHNTAAGPGTETPAASRVSPAVLRTETPTASQDSPSAPGTDTAAGSDDNTAVGLGTETPATGEKSAAVTADATPAKPLVPAIVSDLRLAAVDIDLRLGQNHVQASGALGQGDQTLTLDLDVPVLSSFWPTLPGGGAVQGTVAGGLAAHRGDLDVRYQWTDSPSEELGQAPVEAQLSFQGGWGRGGAGQFAPGAEGWRGQVQVQDARHAGLGLAFSEPAEVSFVPQGSPWQWQVGAASLSLALSEQDTIVIDHARSRGGSGNWETAGAIPELAVSQSLVETLRTRLDLQGGNEEDRGGVVMTGQQGLRVPDIVVGAEWDLSFDGALAGNLHVERLAGDFLVPAQPPFPMGLERLTIDAQVQRTGNGSSRLTADIAMDTRDMGEVRIEASTPMQGLTIPPNAEKVLRVDADIDDLSWTRLLTGDAMDVGGSLQADIELRSVADGSWTSSGTIHGDNIRVVRIDEGIRLLDGTLDARMEGDRVILESLRFPARLRVTPDEWRTAEWVSTNPDAKGGFLEFTGSWGLYDSRGDLHVELYRYPIVQRSDRYAMVSGQVDVDVSLPQIDVRGNVTADAGWFDLDMLGTVPQLDGDVVVLRGGQTREERKEAARPLDITLNVNVDLGPRFYLTGFGVNSGLVGNLNIMMVEGRLTAMGALRTRGGAIEAYGQRLQLRQGTITFQGDITSPVLNIEALRTGLAVEAGVRVAGTAKRPRIDLVSYPAVSEIEKLSWLLLGHGPDQSGGDVALLISVGTSFLGEGQPFYQRFGIDEISMRSGDIGSVGSILPAESVVSGLDYGPSDIENRFITASKGISRNLTLSLQQAVSDSGTVGRASYRLARGLTAELTLGTVNGLALVYRWFSREGFQRAE